MKVIISVHEAGHALVYRMLFEKNPRLILSTTTSNHSGGITLFEGEDIFSRSYLVKKLAVLLAGYCAEKQIFGLEEMTCGSSSDLSRARTMAKSMVIEYGFQLFHTSRSYHSTLLKRSDAQQEVAGLLEEALTVASDILREQERALVKLSDALLQRGCLRSGEIDAILSPCLSSDKRPKRGRRYELHAYRSTFESKLKALKNK
jgi:cell division protease FtsH